MTELTPKAVVCVENPQNILFSDAVKAWVRGEIQATPTQIIKNYYPDLY